MWQNLHFGWLEEFDEFDNFDGLDDFGLLDFRGPLEATMSLGLYQPCKGCNIINAYIFMAWQWLWVVEWEREKMFKLVHTRLNVTSGEKYGMQKREHRHRPPRTVRILFIFHSAVVNDLTGQDQSQLWNSVEFSLAPRCAPLNFV